MSLLEVKKLFHTPFLMRTLLVGILVSIVATLVFVVYSNFQNKSQAVNIKVPFVSIPTPSPVLKTEDGVGLPVRLKIPKINIDAVVEYVGVASDGSMGVPRGPAEVGWFSFGPRPGEDGSAVVAGHFGWKDNIPAVFDNLHELQKGDMIYVEDDKGKTVSFVVREKRVYDPKADASNIFGSIDGGTHLNLITCQGVWSIVKKDRASRIVIFSDKK